MKIYLAHPFLEQELGLKVQAQLEALGITVMNPFQRNEQPIYEAIIAKKELFGPKHAKNIVEGDLRLIERADAIIALVTGKASIGTHMEVFYCSRILQKPVFCLYQLGGATGKIHPWYEFLTKSYSTETELLTAIKNYTKPIFDPTGV